MFRIIKTKGVVSLLIGGQKGIRVSFRWKSAADGVTPYYHLHVFVWGTFLGLNPNTSRRCCSNGVILVSRSFGKED